MARRPARAVPAAFTAIELLVVTAITGVIAVLLVPALEQGRLTATKTACQSNLKTIGLAINGYASDQAGWAPVAATLSRNDGGGGYPVISAGRVIWGTPQPLPDGQTGPMGLGVLCQIGSQATPSPGVSYGNYLNIDTLFCPGEDKARTEAWYFKQHAKPYFGDAWRVWPENQPDPEIWWSNATYGNYYFTSSYAYRHGNWSRWNGTKTASNADWTLNMSLDNCRIDQTTYNARAIVMDGGGDFYWTTKMQHSSLGGGNVLFGDGSVAFWVDPDYANNYYTSAGARPQQTVDKYKNVSVGHAVSSETHHWIAPNLVFSQADKAFNLP